ncbi:hypothetical protein JCM6882_001460 [Rhodosporidiobolus microsporus]
MATPIAELYSSQRLSVATSNPSSPPPLSRSFSTSHSSVSNSGRASRSTHRTSVSIKPEDDPFAPPSPLGGPSKERDVQQQKAREEDHGWGRISEERPSQEATNGAAMTGLVSAVSVAPPHQNGDVVDEGRRPSFFKSLLSRSRGPTAVVRKSRSSNALSTAAISPPILSVDTPGPRLAPLKSRASLVSFADLTGPLSPTGNGATTSRASSLRSRPPLTGVFDSPPPPASNSGHHTRSNSTSIRIEGHPQRPASVLRRPASAMELLPPTDSSKAFAVLGGGPRVTEGNRKAVERLTGVRTSIFRPKLTAQAPEPPEEDDTFLHLGLALTTDETVPTRRIVPDNARYSFATTDSQRSTLYSSTSGSFSRPGVSPRKVIVEEAEPRKSEVAQHGESMYARYLDGQSRAARDEKENRPLSPPPNVPLPPLPTSPPPSFDAQRTQPPKRVEPARHQTGDSTSSSATARPPRPAAVSCPKPPIPPRSSLRPPSRPNSALGSASIVSAGAPSAARPPPPAQQKVNLPKLASQPNLQPVSSADVAAAAAKLSASASAPALAGSAKSSSRPGTAGSATAGPAKPLASLYLVAGLPRDPAAWSLASPVADDDGEGGVRGPAHSPGAVPRFWRPEVLGVQVAAGKEGGLRKEDVGRMQSKAVKLAFDRDVEVIASATQPASTTSIFSFSVPTSSSSGLSSPSLAGSTAFASSTRSSSSSSALSSPSTTYHCVSVLVWSHADAARTTAIRSALIQGQRARTAALKQAAKAVKAGKKLGEKLERQMSSAMGAVPDGGNLWAGVASDTEAETEGQFTETEWETVVSSAAPLTALPPPSIPFWLPYSLILISPSPLYSLLRDYLALSWARYHQDIASHAFQMERVLSTTSPRQGEEVRLPVSVGEKQRDTFFVATMPGEIDWVTGTSLQHDFPLWPVFQALHADNLLTIAELALAPLGRVIFLSRNSLMLGLATLTFQAILEPRGWRGLVHSTAHARDLRIYLEDPGPFLIGVPFASRSLALSSLAPEVVVVDLDSNSVTCSKPTSGALTTGAVRDKARRKLEAAIGNFGGQYGVPRELEETFPGGRFRPLCSVEVAGQAREAERLKPSWDSDEARVLRTFDSILSELPRSGLSRLFRSKRTRKVADLDTNALRVQSMVRKHATNFVERRDLLEAKVNEANQKLAFLMQETTDWQRSFEVFKQFSDKITKESADLKTRLERERREARRLSGQVLAEKERHNKLEASLADVERAREQATQQLSTVTAVQQQLEQQRSLLLQEIQSILLSGEDETSPLFQAVYARVESISQRSDTPSLTRPSTALSQRSTSRLTHRPSFINERIPEDEEEELVGEGNSLPAIHEGDEIRLEAMKLAVQETFRSISSRLSIALETAGQIGGGGHIRLASSGSSGSLTTSPSISTFPPSDDASSLASPLSASTRPPPSPDMGPFHAPTSPVSHGFQPKPLTLTPPVSPEAVDPSSPVAATPSSFVTVRPAHRRIPSARSNGGSSLGHHAKQESAASFASFHSLESTTSSPSTPTAASLAHNVVRQAHQAAGLVRSASYASSIRSLPPLVQRSVSSASRASDYTTTDYESDAQSFVSVSEGGARSGGSSSGGEVGWRSLSRTGDEYDSSGGAFELEELAWTMHHQHQQQLDAAQEQDEDGDLPSPFATSLSRDRADSVASSRSTASYRRPAHGMGHGRQDSCGIDAPPVELFTRSMRGRRGGSLAGSLDMREGVGSPAENGA